MQIVRFSDGTQPHFGVMEPDSSHIVQLKGDPLFNDIEPAGPIKELDQVRLLSPVIPRSKVVGVGTNYRSGEDDPRNPDPVHNPPVLFLKPNTAVIGPNDPITIPSWAKQVVPEAELAVVIRTLAKDVPLDEVDSVIFGYTCANDVSAVLPGAAGPMADVKGFDGACPLGPWIVVDPEFDPENVLVTGSVNGELRQSDTSAHMKIGVRELVSYVSHRFTLLPGDVIVTGTPVGTGPVQAGDVLDVAIAGLGTLTNPVARADF